jgi:hypothetical protein
MNRTAATRLQRATSDLRDAADSQNNKYVYFGELLYCTNFCFYDIQSKLACFGTSNDYVTLVASVSLPERFDPSEPACQVEVSEHSKYESNGPSCARNHNGNPNHNHVLVILLLS